MKGNERVIISGVVVFVLALAFYMLVLSPKRAEVSDLNEQVTSLESSIAEQDQLISFGQQARKEFPRDYSRLITLGKAVPEQADTASLLVELNTMSTRANVDFRGIALAEGGDSEAAPVAPAVTTPPPAEGTEAAPAGGDPAAAGAAAPASTDPAAAGAAAPAPAPATEAGAANLPIGATVGPAGLPTMPYSLTFQGGFFEIADYIGQVDSLVQFDGDKVDVSGRLLTIDGFALNAGRPGANPKLDASFRLTSYVTPSTQGTTAGATPAAPAPGGVQTTPASTAVTP
jgi:Tfp pilus assembly protein PilO